MTEREFAQIVASALVMILRAMNARYGLRMWVLSNQERRDLRRLVRAGEGVVRIADLERYFGEMGHD